MKVVITGGGGFLGLKLARALLARGHVGGAAGKDTTITQLVLLDAAFPPDLPKDARLEAVQGDLSDAARADPTATGAADNDKTAMAARVRVTTDFNFISKHPCCIGFMRACRAGAHQKDVPALKRNDSLSS